MPEERGVAVEVMPEPQVESPPDPQVESPPPAPMPERRETDPRSRLNELALKLTRTRDRGLLIDYLKARRAAR